MKSEAGRGRVKNQVQFCAQLTKMFFFFFNFYANVKQMFRLLFGEHETNVGFECSLNVRNALFLKCSQNFFLSYANIKGTFYLIILKTL